MSPLQAILVLPLILLIMVTVNRLIFKNITRQTSNNGRKNVEIMIPFDFWINP